MWVSILDQGLVTPRQGYFCLLVYTLFRPGLFDSQTRVCLFVSIYFRPGFCGSHARVFLFSCVVSILDQGYVATRQGYFLFVCVFTLDQCSVTPRHGYVCLFVHIYFRPVFCDSQTRVCLFVCAYLL